MLHSFITIYTSDFWIAMLLGVLFFLCLPVLAGKINRLPRINNVICIIPVISDSVFAGKQDSFAGDKMIIIPHTSRSKYLIKNSRHRLGG